MPTVTVEGLRVTYGPVVAVDDLSMEVEAGEIFGLLGKNGAGKTSTVECLSGLRRPTSGRLDVLGHDPRHRSPAMMRQLGVTLQTCALPDKMTVVEAMRLYSAFYPNPLAVDALVERLGLAPVRDQRWRTLSGGQRQRVCVALALIGRPRLAILDELTAGLDPRARRETWSLIEEIRADGVAVILVSHFMEEAERLCDRVVVLESGRVTARGTPAQVIDNALHGSQHITFTTEQPVDLALLQGPSVDVVRREGGRVLVDGHGDTILFVTSTLARAGIVAHDLRVHQANLDDAFVALAQPDASTSKGSVA